MPLYSELMAQGAGEAVKGIIGSANWDWKLTDDGTKAFTKSFGAKYGFPPSQAAHTCYVQTLLYADAAAAGQDLQPLRHRRGARGLRVRRHGQRPDALPRRRPPVLQGRAGGAGKETPENQYDLLEVVEIVPAGAGHLRAGQPDVRGRRPRDLQPGRLTATCRRARPRAAAFHGATRATPAAVGAAWQRQGGHGGMDAILLQLLNGLDKGSAYALIALGLTLIFGTLGVVNFAHGALFMLGAFTAVTFREILTMQKVVLSETETTAWGTPLEIHTPYAQIWFGDFGADADRLLGADVDPARHPGDAARSASPWSAG